jgi:hypothetical protein
LRKGKKGTIEKEKRTASARPQIQTIQKLDETGWNMGGNKKDGHGQNRTERG